MTMNAYTEDLGFDPSDINGDEIVAWMDKRIAGTISDTEKSDFWKVLTAPETDPATIVEIMKEVYLEIVMYQPDAIEAAIAVIGQMPRYIPAEIVEEMLHHQAEEFDHGEMALRDYVALGGDEEYARNRPMCPTAFNTAGVWWMLQQKRDPFAYLGALYPFEGLTPIITEKIKGFLTAKGMDASSLGYIEYHSTADIEHARIVKELIAQIADQFPESKPRICYGLNYFLQVYPIPGWNAAYQRAMLKLEGSGS